MRTIFKAYVYLAICGGLLLTTSVRANEQANTKPSVHVETLIQSSQSWDGVAYKSYPSGAPELTILKITIPANTELPWHTHPMPNAGYVLSGELTVEKKETGEKRVLTEGQTSTEMVDELHRCYTGDKPAVLIVFYAGTKGMPLSEHEKQK